MPQPCRGTRLAQETKPRRFITVILVINDLQRHRATEIDIERLVSNPHRTATQLDRFPVFARHQFVVLKSSRWLNRILRNRRLAGNNPASKTLAKHADRAEFHRSRDFTTAARAGTFEVRAHGPRRPSDAIKASQRVWIPSSACNCLPWESGAWL